MGLVVLGGLEYLVRQNGLGFGIDATKAALDDLVRKYTFRSPRYVPIAGEPGELAALNTPGSYEGYRQLVPEELRDDEEAWNRCAARVLLTVATYRPIEEVGDVDCPAFVLEAREDQLVPGDVVDRVVRRLPDVQRLRVDGDHFDPYFDPLFTEAVARQTDFLEQHLLG